MNPTKSSNITIQLFFEYKIEYTIIKIVAYPLLHTIIKLKKEYIYKKTCVQKRHKSKTTRKNTRKNAGSRYISDRFFQTTKRIFFFFFFDYIKRQPPSFAGFMLPFEISILRRIKSKIFVTS